MLPFWCIVVSLVVGVIVTLAAIKWDLRDILGRERRITKPEFILASIVSVILTYIVAVAVGPSLARSSAVNGYREFYNGSVVRVLPDTISCQRDGACVHEYECDPYLVKVVDRPASTDSKGNYQPEISHYETRYHECPYATREVSYVFEDSLGRTIVIGDHYFENNPRPWRFGEGIPSGVPRQAPRRWVEARKRLRAGMSDPVTAPNTYANFILASGDKLYKEYGGSIASYRKAGLLPKHTANLGEQMFYDYETRANKFQVVGGVRLTNLPLWQDRLMRFNAALGSELQGDLHIVVVPAQAVANPDDYVTALKAYWQSLGKWSISKNGIILAIGASPDGSSVIWTRAETGMPIGNSTMLQALNLSLDGSGLDPMVLLGNVPASVTTVRGKTKVNYDLSQGGMIGSIIFVQYPFKRPCMECKGKGDTGTGYVSLRDFVPITTGAQIMMFMITIVLTSAIWAAMLLFDPFGYTLRYPSRTPR